jgi:hypothetical protein
VAPDAVGGGESPVELVLYVAPGSPACAKARANLEAALKSYDRAHVRVTVQDVSQDVEAAERDRIVFTPTLLLRGADVGCVVGDLSRAEAVDALLMSVGVEKNG